MGNDYFLILLPNKISVVISRNHKTGRETHLSEIIHCQSYGNDRHDYDGKSILLIVFAKPQTDTEELKYVKWI